MKRLMSLAAVVAVVLAAVLSCAGRKSPSTLEISFNYTKQAGPGSNQYAIWVEDGQGAVVKTLFVTEFTSKGRARAGQPLQRGYTYRPSCVPTWVKDVKAESLSDEQMDAFTGATPAESGIQTFTWDFTDQAGKPVPKGNYKFFVEATYFNEGVVTYSGDFSTGTAAGELAYETVFASQVEEHKDMVTNVSAVLK